MRWLNQKTEIYRPVQRLGYAHMNDLVTVVVRIDTENEKNVKNEYIYMLSPL